MIRQTRALPNGTIRLRPFPQPYKAMLAITNDIDCATWNDFALLHDYLNGTEPTDLGIGLGLDIGDSFFFFTVRPSHDQAFSYFDDLEGRIRSPYADMMDRLMTAGYLDSLHSWGNFSEKGGFRRSHAMAGQRVLADLHHPIRVWINHGDAHNQQMIGTQGWNDPRSTLYHEDLVTQAGVRWIWSNALTRRIGQSSQERFPWIHPTYWFNDIVRPITRVLTKTALTQPFYHNQLTTHMGHKHGSLRSFVRYGDWKHASSNDVDLLLSDHCLNQLESRGGYLSLYCHLFKRTAGTSLRQVNWSCFTRLQHRFQQGRILVTTTSRMLAYHDMLRQLQWRTRHEGQRIRIDMDVMDPWHMFRRDDLMGVTFTCPNPHRVDLFFRNTLIETTIHPGNASELPSIGIPWRKLFYPCMLHTTHNKGTVRHDMRAG